MDIIELSLQEQVKTGRSHVARIKLADLNDTAGTSKTLKIFPYVARDIIGDFMFDLVTPADGGATSALAMKAGYNGASVDDDDAFIPAVELHADATEILAGIGAIDGSTVDGTYGAQEQAVIGSLRDRANKLAAQEAGDVELVFTATGGNLTLLTQFEVLIYFNVIRLPSLRGING